MTGLKFNSLQAGRALAALVVVLHHGVGASRDFVALVPEPLNTIGAFGYLGVDFFFILSGFIIYYTNIRKIGTPGWPARYLQGRFFRVYLPYWAVTGVLVTAYLLVPSLSAGARETELVSSFLLVPSRVKPILSVGWTLQHEVMFYALFLLGALSGRLLTVIAVWAVAILGYAALSDGWHDLLKFALHPINLEFIAGMGIAWCFIAGQAARPLGAALGLAAGVALFAVAGFDRDWSVFIGLGLASVVSMMVALEAAGKLRVAALWVLLGDASYAIYLIHLPLMSLTARLCAKVPVLDNWPAALATGLGASIAAGLVFHLAFERPLLAALHAMPIFARKAAH